MMFECKGAAFSAELREKYGRAAIQRVREQFTWEDKANTMIELYSVAALG